MIHFVLLYVTKKFGGMGAKKKNVFIRVYGLNRVP